MVSALPRVAPISAEVRLHYVLRHFRQAFDNVPELTIGYAASQPEIEIEEAAGNFFAGQNPYPPEPTWREWDGQRLPFFFDEAVERPLLELLPGGRARIQADIISAAFYLLSGWQEFFSEERDQHGRFPYAASVQCRYGFVTVPVVNYYFDVLRAAVEHATGHVLRPRSYAGGATWAAFITHDVDNLRSAWKGPAKAALWRGDWREFGQQLWHHLTRPDAWDNLTFVQQTVAGYGAKSTFFVLPEHRPALNGTPNADYRIRRVQPQLQQLSAADTEVALHGSLRAADEEALRREAALVAPAASRALRFHYLRWEPRTTPHVVAEAGFVYDSTLGFAEHFGFRNSYCRPFYPFNFSEAAAFRFLEIPLNVMDATLHHPRYLQLAPEEMLPALTPMLQEIERFGGVCTVLWHNENFDPANTRNGPREFHALMEYLRARAVTFVNGTDILLRHETVRHEK